MVPLIVPLDPGYSPPTDLSGHVHNYYIPPWPGDPPLSTSKRPEYQPPSRQISPIHPDILAYSRNLPRCHVGAPVLQHHPHRRRLSLFLRHHPQGTLSRTVFPWDTDAFANKPPDLLHSRHLSDAHHSHISETGQLVSSLPLPRLYPLHPHPPHLILIGITLSTLASSGTYGRIFRHRGCHIRDDIRHDLLCRLEKFWKHQTPYRDPSLLGSSISPPPPCRNTKHIHRRPECRSPDRISLRGHHHLADRRRPDDRFEKTRISLSYRTADDNYPANYPARNNYAAVNTLLLFRYMMHTLPHTRIQRILCSLNIFEVL